MNKLDQNFKNKKILIIGGTGFIGSRLADELCKICNKIYVISLNKYKNKNNDIYYFQIDFSKEDNINKFFQKHSFDYIFNLGFYVDHSLYSNKGYKIINDHLFSTIHQFKFINKKKLKRYIYVGSADEYEYKNNHSSREIEREISRTPYSFSKSSSIHFLKMLHLSEQWPVSIARIFLTYGPGQKENRIIPYLINQGYNKGFVNVSSGNQIRDFCYIDDIVDGLIKIALNKNSIGLIINLASGKPIKIKNIIQMISKKLKFKVNFGKYSKKITESSSQVADISIAKKVLKWKPKVSLEEGIQLTINHELSKK